MKTGCTRLQIDASFYTLEQGDIAFVNSQEVHSSTPMESGTELVCIVFNEALVRNSGMDRTEQQYFTPYLNQRVGGTMRSCNDHIAKPDIENGVISGWKEDMEELAKYPNVCCKLSGMVTEACLDNWRASDFVPYLDVVFDAFGVERLMIGSDWPVCLLGGTYTNVMQIVMDYVQPLPQAEQEKVLGGNCARFYGII